MLVERIVGETIGTPNDPYGVHKYLTNDALEKDQNLAAIRADGMAAIAMNDALDAAEDGRKAKESEKNVSQ